MKSSDYRTLSRKARTSLSDAPPSPHSIITLFRNTSSLARLIKCLSEENLTHLRLDSLDCAFRHITSAIDAPRPVAGPHLSKSSHKSRLSAIRTTATNLTHRPSGRSPCLSPHDEESRHDRHFLTTWLSSMLADYTHVLRILFVIVHSRHTRNSDHLFLGLGEPHEERVSTDVDSTATSENRGSRKHLLGYLPRTIVLTVMRAFSSALRGRWPFPLARRGLESGLK